MNRGPARGFTSRYPSAHVVSSTPHHHIEGGSMTKMVARVALLAVLCALGGTTVLRAAAVGTHRRHHLRPAARRHPRRDRHRHERRDEPRANGRDRFGGQLRRHAARSGHLQRERRDPRLPDDGAGRARADRRPGGASRAGAQSRRRCRRKCRSPPRRRCSTPNRRR